MTKQQVRSTMLSAKTLADCALARDVYGAYLLQHPEDEAFLLDASESLFMIEQGLKAAVLPAGAPAAARAS